MFNYFQLSTFNFQLKKLGYLAIGLILLTACRPNGILSSKQMEDIFVDLHTAEAFLQEAGYTFGHEEEVRAYYLTVLEQHGTTQAQFDSSLVWYTSNPTIFDKIYPKVIDRLQARADAYQKLLDAASNSTSKPSEQWIRECQYGLDWLYWQKKYEKKTQKFVYVEKLL